MQKKDAQTIRKEFEVRQTRQILAIAAALFLVLLCAVLHKRPILFLHFSKGTLFAMQITVIVSFLAFSAFNWRCPACGHSLGSDIFRSTCRKCGVILKK
ncbi:MAG TPA: hypothetical protein VK654_13505 [Nitrospirota bacterium]|nr:hypothetical protein [Nitrospirota bacterium]